MNQIEQIKKLRALECNSPFESERLVAKKKADALEKEICNIYEEWMADLSEMLHRNLEQKYADELYKILVEKYYSSGYVGNYGYQECFKEGVSKYVGEYYYSKYTPKEETEDEKICDEAFEEGASTTYEFLKLNML